MGDEERKFSLNGSLGEIFNLNFNMVTINKIVTGKNPKIKLKILKEQYAIK